ncbi:MAG: hypothetical protein K8T91_28375 [Planctomycetes bacterium]|nr:hypothetical protein [Planctomycetota bacterium]
MRYTHTTDCRNCGRPLVALLAEWSFRVLWSHARKQNIKGLVKWAQEKGPLCPPCLAVFGDAPLHRKSAVRRPSDRWGIPLLGEAPMFSTITCTVAAFFVACLSAFLWLAHRAPDDELG